MLKDRHIDENILINHLKQDTLRDILPKIFWEKNTLVTHNPDIPASQIMAKSKTDDFPSESITVRINSLKRKIATVYFYGKVKTKRYAGGTHTWRYVDEKLRVTLPTEGKYRSHKQDYSYYFQGQLPAIFDMHDLCWALDYIKEQFNTMTGGKAA